MLREREVTPDCARTLPPSPRLVRTSLFCDQLALDKLDFCCLTYLRCSEHFCLLPDLPQYETGRTKLPFPSLPTESVRLVTETHDRQARSCTISPDRDRSVRYTSSRPAQTAFTLAMDPAFVPFQPSQVRHRRFCFCIPVRWGTWFLTAVTAVSSATIALAIILSLWSDDNDMPKLAAVQVVMVFVWGGLAVICGFGASESWRQDLSSLLFFEHDLTPGTVDRMGRDHHAEERLGKAQACEL